MKDMWNGWVGGDIVLRVSRYDLWRLIYWVDRFDRRRWTLVWRITETTSWFTLYIPLAWREQDAPRIEVTS
jgi:hypothetical protein